jgi:hypothetical protein
VSSYKFNPATFLNRIRSEQSFTADGHHDLVVLRQRYPELKSWPSQAIHKAWADCSETVNGEA